MLSGAIAAITPAQSVASGRSMDIAVKSVRVEDGRMTWHNAGTGQRVTVALNSFKLLDPTETSPVTFYLVATYAGTEFTANGETGPTARLRDSAAETPWPVTLRVTTTPEAAVSAIRHRCSQQAFRAR
jgi:hypothetical protein